MFAFFQYIIHSTFGDDEGSCFLYVFLQELISQILLFQSHNAGNFHLKISLVVGDYRSSNLIACSDKKQGNSLMHGCPDLFRYKSVAIVA